MRWWDLSDLEFLESTGAILVLEQEAQGSITMDSRDSKSFGSWSLIGLTNVNHTKPVFHIYFYMYSLHLLMMRCWCDEATYILVLMWQDNTVVLGWVLSCLIGVLSCMSERISKLPGRTPELSGRDSKLSERDSKLSERFQNDIDSFHWPIRLSTCIEVIRFLPSLLTKTSRKCNNPPVLASTVNLMERQRLFKCYWKISSL